MEIKLRKFRKGDEISLQKNINNRMIYRYTLNIPYPYSMKDAKVFMSKCLANYGKRKKTKIHLAVTHNDEVIGGIGLNEIKGHRAELGYWLGKKYWGKGIMTNAVKQMTQKSFNEFSLKRVYAFVFPKNKASARVLEKAGYQYEGTLRKHACKKGKFRDEMIFGKLKR